MTSSAAGFGAYVDVTMFDLSAHMLLGSVGLHCVSHSPCPVVVVRHAHADQGR